MKKTKQKPLDLISDMSRYVVDGVLDLFTMKMGGTEYTINMFFNDKGRETVLRQFLDLFKTEGMQQ